MTTEKIEMGAMLARNANQVTSTATIQGRQEVAASGKTPPVANPEGAAAEGKKKQLEQAVKHVSKHIQNVTRELNFSIDEELDRFVVTVLDQESGEVIRQIPTEDMLELAKSLADAQQNSSKAAMKGLLFQGDA